MGTPASTLPTCPGPRLTPKIGRGFGGADNTCPLLPAAALEVHVELGGIGADGDVVGVWGAVQAHGGGIGEDDAGQHGGLREGEEGQEGQQAQHGMQGFVRGRRRRAGGALHGTLRHVSS